MMLIEILSITLFHIMLVIENTQYYFVSYNDVDLNTQYYFVSYNVVD